MNRERGKTKRKRKRKREKIILFDLYILATVSSKYPDVGVFKASVGKIATEGFCTPNTNALRILLK